MGVGDERGWSSDVRTDLGVLEERQLPRPSGYK